MFRSGRLLPGLMSAPSPASTWLPCPSPFGAMMYRFSPSAKCSSAIRAVRFGSYSMCATLAGTPSLSYRLKSTSRYACLCPPPMCRVVIRPLLLRPPVLGLGTTSDFSGVDRVTSAKSATEAPRRPGVVGLYLRIAIALVPSRSGARGGEDVDALAVGNAHDGPLGVGTTPGAVAHAPLLARPVEGVDPGDVDLEHRLDGDLDLGLVGVGRDEERVLVLVQQSVALLAHHGGEQDVTVVADLDAAHESSSLTLVGPVRGAAVLDGELAGSLTASSSLTLVGPVRGAAVPD